MATERASRRQRQPFDYLCWTLALYRAGDLGATSNKLVQTLLGNNDLIPILLGLEPTQMDYWHGSNWEELDCAAMGPMEVFALWDEDAVTWARQTYHSAEVQRVRALQSDLRTTESRTDWAKTKSPGEHDVRHAT